MYLLDTNILVHLIRGKGASVGIVAHFGFQTDYSQCLISVVTVGEMYALARKWSWGPKKLVELDRLLARLVWVNINQPDILIAYGELDHASEMNGKRMGKNDLWIAATAQVSGATLLTTDRDFEHLHPAQLTRIRIDPQSGKPVP